MEHKSEIRHRIAKCAKNTIIKFPLLYENKFKFYSNKFTFKPCDGMSSSPLRHFFRGGSCPLCPAVPASLAAVACGAHEFPSVASNRTQSV